MVTEVKKMRWLLVLFLVLPALEIGVFIWAGGMIGPWWVVGLILLTGILGVMITKQQGMETWQRGRQAINEGQPPTEYIINGICIFIGGVFLFTPGFITDIVGFMLVIPVTRDIFKHIIMNVVKRMIAKNKIIYRRW